MFTHFNTKHCLFLLCTFCTMLLLIEPRPAMEAVHEALRLCAETIIPSLFPFLIFSSFLTALLPHASINRIFSPFMQRLFRLGGNSAAVLALGFTGGYPVGVRTVASFYQNGYLRKSEAEHLLAFSNNSGPGFLLGIIGIGVFNSTIIGLWLYVIHILSALLVGFLFRPRQRIDTPSATISSSAAANKNLSQLFTEAVTGSFSTVLNICAFVLFFMIALRMLSFTGILHLLSSLITFLLSPFNMTEHLATALIAGFLELSTGSSCLQGAILTPGTAALSSFLLGWGGLSVHCQSLIFILETDLSCKSYFTGKLLQALLSALLSFLFFSVFYI